MALFKTLWRGLLLILLVLTLAGSWLLATEPGLRWLLQQSPHWLPQGAQLRVGEVDATLWRGGKLRQVSYRDRDRVINAATLTLQWQPLKLLRGELQLDRITLQDASYQWLGGGDSSPWQAGDLDLPVVLTIAELRLQRGEIIIAGQERPIALQSGQLSGSWTPQAITLSRLQLQPAIDTAMTEASDSGTRADAGSLSLQARLQLDQQLGWQSSITLERLNPAFVASDIRGSISGTIGLAGRLVAAGELKTVAGLLSLDPLQLQGQLNGYPLSASGSLHSGPQGVQVRQLQIRSGDAEFSAQGAFEPPADTASSHPEQAPATLQWQLKIPELQQLLADARGRISGKGQISGIGEHARVEGGLTLKGVALRGLRAKHLNASFNLRADAAAASRVSVKGSGLAVGGTDIQTLTASLKGPLAKHSLSLDMQQAAGTLALQASGRFDPDEHQWAGDITRLKLHIAKAGHWALAKRVGLKVAPERIDLERFCLRREVADSDASLCAKLHWRPQGGSADASLKGLPLLALRPLLGDGIQQLSGNINGKLHVDLATIPTANATLTVTPGELSIKLDRYRQLKVAHHGASLDARLERKQLQAQWHMKVGEHSAEGDLSIARPALDRDPANAAIRGHIKLDLAQAGLIDAFLPNVREAEGSLKARLQLGGSLAQPGVGGRVELQARHALLPMAGVALSDIQLKLHGDGSRKLTLSGGVTSGPGRVDLNGTLLLDPAAGWPLRLKLSGKRVQALDLPQVTALVNPDISVESDSKDIKVRGKIIIPEGKIHLRSLPEQAVSASSDVVIVGPGGKPEVSAGRRIDASVEVSLGKQVSFKGFGLDGRLSGHIRLIQQPGKLLSGKGELGVNNATLFFLGERLDVERARLLYIGGPLDAPGLNVRASRDVDDTEVGVTITGTFKDPNISGFASDPGITSRDALAILATGLSPDDAGFDQAARSTAASIGAMALTDPIAAKTGLDQVSFRSGTDDPADASVYVGKNLSQDLNVGVSVGVQNTSDKSKLITRYKLRKNLHLEAHTSAASSGLDLKYTIELK